VESPYNFYIPLHFTYTEVEQIMDNEDDIYDTFQPIESRIETTVYAADTPRHPKIPTKAPIVYG